MQTKTISSPADARDERPNRFASAAFRRRNYSLPSLLVTSRDRDFTPVDFVGTPISSTKAMIDNI